MEYKSIPNSIKDVDEPCYFIRPNDNKHYMVETVCSYLDMLVQIKKHKENGWKIQYKDVIVNVDSNGVLDNYPEGLFDKYMPYLAELI
jgi:hypothetical protein